ncbi:MAG: hypothetical protein HYR85_05695 [Planctomycetes bacterium]|nr:hypothetical protein [Planctomycetota bacterium]MBI3843657.1 hypothetical protein [Planctomycetota bacterium]
MSARLDVDPALCEAVVEDVVRVAAHAGIESYGRAVRRALDPLYEESVVDRHPASEAAYRDLFREWGYEALLMRALDEFPVFFRTDALRRIVIRGPSRPQEAGADFSGSSRSPIGIAVPVALFRDPPELARFLRREIQRVADLFDPSFAYTGASCRVLCAATTENAVRDRLRLFWSMNADGRIAAKGLQPSRSFDEWASLVARAIPDFGPDQARGCAEHLWNRGLVPFPELLAMARQPDRALGARDGARGLTEAETCPLCRVAVRRLVAIPPGTLTVEDLAEIRDVVGKFDPESGACERCVESFAVAGVIEA